MEPIHVIDIEDLDSPELNVSESGHRQSLYVETFQKIQDVVLQHERFLFSEEEQACLDALARMSYEARYLFIRLCLRKRNKWHSLVSLEQRYGFELGDAKRISETIDELYQCNEGQSQSRTKPQNFNPIEAEQENKEPIIIDLTLDSDEEEDIGVLKMEENPKTLPKPNVLRFAEDESSASLNELLDCLTIEELKSLGKQMKVSKTSQNRPDLTKAILSHSSTQSILSFPLARKPSNTGYRRDHVSSGSSRQTQQYLIRTQTLKILGRCIRIHSSIYSLIDRLNIVFFRSTTYDSSLFLPALLSNFKKRHHAAAEFSRTPDIFPDREAFLKYYDALVLEAEVEETLVADDSRLPRKDGTAKDSASKRPSTERAKIVREKWSSVYDHWKELVASEDEVHISPLRARFHHGHIWTRIVYKGTEALALLKEYELEIKVLKELLGQRKWRIGRRGAWYNRLALILMTHIGKDTKNFEEAIDIVEAGLRDESTHLVYRPRLVRRLERLEKKLQVDPDDRHVCDRTLKAAKEVYIRGTRLNPKPSVSVGDDKSLVQRDVGGSNWFQANSIASRVSQAWKPCKTLWQGKDGMEVSVEDFALEHYAGLGYRGYHSEGRIVATLFGLLFWDILFAQIPGAFETPYQPAPLDILDDTFYFARKELIENRLHELRIGKAPTILEQVIAKERPTRTVCIGVDWDFEATDLLDIVKCLNGDTLAIICKMICEDYSHWRGGVPDLLIWNAQNNDCRFVEVKSPNDTLQENQKVWIDLLLGAGASVDLCHVIEQGQNAKKKRKSRSQSKQDDNNSEYEDDSRNTPSSRKRSKLLS